MLNESAHSQTRCKKNIHVLEMVGMITRQNAWFANLYYPAYMSQNTVSFRAVLFFFLLTYAEITVSNC